MKQSYRLRDNFSFSVNLKENRFWSVDLLKSRTKFNIVKKTITIGSHFISYYDIPENVLFKWINEFQTFPTSITLKFRTLEKTTFKQDFQKD